MPFVVARSSGRGFWTEGDEAASVTGGGRSVHETNLVVTATVVNPGRQWNSAQAEPNLVVFDGVQLTSRENRSNPQPGDPAPTLNQGGRAHVSYARVVRRLTEVECERLQGFPDDHTDVPGVSSSARYRMLGNAVAVPVARWIGRRLPRADGDVAIHDHSAGHAVGAAAEAARGEHR